MFDKSSRRPDTAPPDSREGAAPEDERIALRCSLKELQLVDSFVSSGEFRNRSELVRQAVRAFLRSRAASGVPGVSAPPAPRDLVEVAVRLRSDEVETIRIYGDLAANGQELEDLLAQLVRRGELELKVTETVARARASVRGSEAARERLHALGQTGDRLERKGVVGR